MVTTVEVTPVELQHPLEVGVIPLHWQTRAFLMDNYLALTIFSKVEAAEKFMERSGIHRSLIVAGLVVPRGNTTIFKATSNLRPPKIWISTVDTFDNRSSADHLQMKSSTDGTRGCWWATATSLPRISTLMCGVALTRDGNDRLAPRRCALHARDGAQVPWACPWRHRRCGGDEAHTCGRARSRVGRVREGTGSGVRVRLGVCGGSAGWAEAWRDVLGEAKEEEGVAGAPYAPRPPRRMGSLLVCIVARARARTGRYGAAREGTHAYVESRDIVGGNGGEYRLTDLMAWICDGWVLFFATLREGKQQHLPLLPDGGVAAACWGDSDVNGESRKRVGGVGILCVGAGGGAGGAGGWRARKEAAAAGAKGRR
ncbi:hypothetical protein B0H11DRAFT_1909159 [Mycena galericulata]|nr:hypothetical protein B0H11DRAFT_1909159 [Mycena galericulata]